LIAVRSVSGLGKAVLVTTAGIGTLIRAGVANASLITFISVSVSGTRVALDKEIGKGVVAP
jgi:hypothetical protein